MHFRRVFVLAALASGVLAAWSTLASIAAGDDGLLAPDASIVVGEDLTGVSPVFGDYAATASCSFSALAPSRRFGNSAFDQVAGIELEWLLLHHH